jgi:hypothetical protein
MKKTILSWLLVGASCAAFAQTETGTDSTNRNTNTSVNNTTTTDNSSMNNNSTTNNAALSSNNAYSAWGNTVAVPYNVQTYMQRDYPMAQNVMWQQNGDWYHGVYLNSGRYSHVYYNQAGATYTVALPVTQTWVPDDMITKITSMFGPAIYDVTTMKGMDGQNVYQVRLVENGQIRSQWIGDDGNAIADPFRVEVESTSTDAGMNNANTNLNTTTTTDLNTNTNTMTEGKMKIKTKTADGKERKVKIKDGEVKVKED